MSRFQELRKERIDLMKRKLKEELGTGKTEISYDTFIAKYCLETGVSKRTAMEYLDILDGNGEVQLDQFYRISDRRIRAKPID